MRREQLTRTQALLADLEARQRAHAAEGIGWLAAAAEQARRIDRSTASGAAWFRLCGVPRDRVRSCAATARRARDRPEVARLFRRMAVEVLFPLRRPVRGG
jgi:hypothetical protein